MKRQILRQVLTESQKTVVSGRMTDDQARQADNLSHRNIEQRY